MQEDKIIVKRGSFGSLFSGFLIGGLIGAAVALLAAPKSGAETREMLREKSTELKDQVVDTAGHTRDRAQKVLENARGKVSDVAQAARDRASEMMHREADMMEDTSQKIDTMADKTSRANF